MTAIEPGARARRPQMAALALSCLIWLAVPAAAQETPTVEVRGAVKTALRLDADALGRFPAESIGSFTQSRRADGGESASTVRGVLLTALLDRAALAGKDRHDWKKSVVVATASDGYRVVFSWPELFNTPAGASVLVVFERDGQPLGAQEGRIALVSGGDQRTGPRHVRWLQTLDVRVLGE